MFASALQLGPCAGAYAPGRDSLVDVQLSSLASVDRAGKPYHVAILPMHSNVSVCITTALYTAPLGEGFLRELCGRTRSQQISRPVQTASPPATRSSTRTWPHRSFDRAMSRSSVVSGCHGLRGRSRGTSAPAGVFGPDCPHAPLILIFSRPPGLQHASVCRRCRWQCRCAAPPWHNGCVDTAVVSLHPRFLSTDDVVLLFGYSSCDCAGRGSMKGDSDDEHGLGIAPGSRQISR